MFHYNQSSVLYWRVPVAVKETRKSLIGQEKKSHSELKIKIKLALAAVEVNFTMQPPGREGLIVTTRCSGFELGFEGMLCINCSRKDTLAQYGHSIKVVHLSH